MDVQNTTPPLTAPALDQANEEWHGSIPCGDAANMSLQSKLVRQPFSICRKSFQIHGRNSKATESAHFYHDHKQTHLLRKLATLHHLLVVLLVVGAGLDVGPRLDHLRDGQPVLPELFEPLQEGGVFLASPAPLSRRRRLALLVLV